MSEESEYGHGYWSTLHDRVSSVISWKERCTTAEKRIEQLEGALRTIASNNTRHMEINHAFCVNTAIEALAAPALSAAHGDPTPQPDSHADLLAKADALRDRVAKDLERNNGPLFGEQE